MTKEEEEKFLVGWGPVCLCCGREDVLEGTVQYAATSVVITEGLAHGLPYVGNAYMACKECVDNEELI